MQENKNGCFFSEHNVETLNLLNCFYRNSARCQKLQQVFE